VADDLKKKIRSLMCRVRQHGRLPGSEQVVTEAFERLGLVEGRIDPREVIDQFEPVLRSVWEEALSVLESHENHAYSAGIPRELIRSFPKDVKSAERVARARGFQAGVTHLLANWYCHLRLCFLSVSQSRKTRGGKDFELQRERLLSLAGVPYETQVTENRTDFVLPSIAVFQRNRNEALVVSAKRTLRERWREVAEELFNLRSPNVYLLTADENVSPGHVDAICGRYNIYLVVWEHLKEARFRDRPLVLSYGAWARERLARLRP